MFWSSNDPFAAFNLCSLNFAFCSLVPVECIRQKPQLDPSTGEQEPPEITSAPLKMLTFVGVLLSLLTLGGFLLFHDQTVTAPYSPINVDDAARGLDRGIAPDRPMTSR